MGKEDAIIRGILNGRQAREYDKARLIEKIITRKGYGDRKLRKQETKRKIIHLGDMLSHRDKVK